MDGGNNDLDNALENNHLPNDNDEPPQLNQIFPPFFNDRLQELRPLEQGLVDLLPIPPREERPLVDDINDEEIQHFLDAYRTHSNSPQLPPPPRGENVLGYRSWEQPHLHRHNFDAFLHDDLEGAFDFDLQDLQPLAYRRAPEHNPPADSEINASDTSTDHSNNDDDEDSFASIQFPPTPQDTQDPPTAPRPTETIDLTLSSPTMPSATTATKKRKRNVDETGSSSIPKPTSARATKSPKPVKRDSVEVVDLEDIEEKEDYEAFKARQQAETIKRQNEEEANKPVKLAEFQCIICMDQPTDLTVTHCGHLFCGECLHSALHAGDKKCCPVCRATIVISQSKKSKHGVYPLQMKLMTAVRKGKQPAKA